MQAPPPPLLLLLLLLVLLLQLLLPRYVCAMVAAARLWSRPLGAGALLRVSQRFCCDRRASMKRKLQILKAGYKSIESEKRALEARVQALEVCAHRAAAAAVVAAVQ